MSFALRDDEKGSYQVNGSVEYFTGGEHHDAVRKWVGGKRLAKSAVVIHVEEVYNKAERIA